MSDTLAAAADRAQATDPEFAAVLRRLAWCFGETDKRPGDGVAEPPTDNQGE